MARPKKKKPDQDRIEKLEKHIQDCILIVQSYGENHDAKNKDFTQKKFIEWLERSKIIINEN